MAGLTKQHFKKIAEILNKYYNKPYGYINAKVINDLSNYFKTQNPLFNENQFKKACLK